MVLPNTVVLGHLLQPLIKTLWSQPLASVDLQLLVYLNKRKRKTRKLPEVNSFKQNLEKKFVKLCKEALIYHAIFTLFQLKEKHIISRLCLVTSPCNRKNIVLFPLNPDLSLISDGAFHKKWGKQMHVWCYLVQFCLQWYSESGSVEVQRQGSQQSTELRIRVEIVLRNVAQREGCEDWKEGRNQVLSWPNYPCQDVVFLQMTHWHVFSIDTAMEKNV